MPISYLSITTPDPAQVLWQLQQPAAVTILLILLGLTFPLRGVILLIVGGGRGLRPSRTSIVVCVIETLLGVGILCLARVSVLGLCLLLAAYLFAILAAKGIDCYLYARARQWRYFIPSAAATWLGSQFLLVLLTTPPFFKRQILLLFSLLMLAVIGASTLCDLLFYLVRSCRFRRVLNNIRFALPDYVGLMLPLHMTDAAAPEPLAPAQTGDVEVLFQVSRRGIGIVGHCELCIDGRTLTYGCYEPESRRFFRSMGGGVIFRAPREAYLRWAMQANHKKIVSYTLRLPPEQMARVRRQLARLGSQVTPWTPQESPQEFIMRVRQLPGVQVYRVHSGPFRTYFVPTINCVSITSSILSRTELGGAIMPGIKTPGAYMDLLDRQFYSGSSVVVAKHVYGEA